MLPVGGSIKVLDAVAVNATAVVYSNHFDTRMGHYFGTRILATSASGTPSLKIEWESGHVPPATANVVDTNYVLPDTGSLIVATHTAETYKVYGVNPPPDSYGRLRITGNAANPADTVVTGYIFVQG